MIDPISALGRWPYIGEIVDINSGDFASADAYAIIFRFGKLGNGTYGTAFCKVMKYNLVKVGQRYDLAFWD